MATVQPVPALVDDLVEEIHLRFPPDDPAALVHAALVSKGWRRLVSGLGFRCRFREAHSTAPMLGFLRFQPTTSFRPCFAGEHSGTICRAVDAHHGRVLINRYSSPDLAFFIWDPEDGKLGFAMIHQSKLSMWSRDADGWAQNRVIELSTLLPASTFSLV